MTAVAIIAALDREIKPLVSNWQVRSFTHNGRKFQVYEKDDLAAIAGGIGGKAAQAAARALVAEYRPRVLISAGVAGAMAKELTAGRVITPATIIDSATGTRYRSEAGVGVLVTASEIADGKLKRSLAQRFGACAVDMEAASVAEVAREEGIAFRCVKAISDEAGFNMPPLSQFVDENGRFRTRKFAVWAALHPLHWRGIVALARNTRQATEALCNHLRNTSSSVFETRNL